MDTPAVEPLGARVYTGLLVLLALLLVVLNALFVAAEFAFVKVRKTRLEILAAEGSRRARSALLGVEHLDAYLSVCQLGITLASLGLGWIGEPAVAALLREREQLREEHFTQWLADRLRGTPPTA